MSYEFSAKAASAQAAAIKIERISVGEMLLSELQQRLFTAPCCLVLDDAWMIVARIAQQDLALRSLEYKASPLTAKTCSELVARMQEQEQTRNLLSSDANAPFRHWNIAVPQILEPGNAAPAEKGSAQ